MKWRWHSLPWTIYYQYSGAESMTVTTGVPDPGVTVPWRLLTPEGSDQFPHKKRLSTNPPKLRGSGGRPEGEKIEKREAERGRS